MQFKVWFDDMGKRLAIEFDHKPAHGEYEPFEILEGIENGHWIAYDACWHSWSHCKSACQTPEAQWQVLEALLSTTLAQEPGEQEKQAMDGLFSNAPHLAVECGNCQSWHQHGGQDCTDGLCVLTGCSKWSWELGCHRFNWDLQVLRLRFES